MTGDTITVVRARTRRLAKLVRADGSISDYDQARTVDLIAVPVDDLDALGRLLWALLPRPDCAIVRGAVADVQRSRGVRRLIHPDAKTGDLPTLQDAAHGWLGLDLEGVERPADVMATDLAGCAAAAILRLPAAFHGARCIAQASGGHGIKPGVRLRLWYWLSRQLTGAELKRWLRGYPCDPAVFRPAQLIYTAAPIFQARADHLPTRIALVPGRTAVVAPSADELAPPPRRPLPPLPVPGAAGADRYAYAALSAAAARVASAPVNSRHETVVGQARSLARLINAGLLTETEVDRCLGDAIETAGKERAEASAILTWAIQHPSADRCIAAIGSR